MLPGHVAGHYPRSALDIDLVRLARWAGARYVEGRVEDIDRVGKTLSVVGRPALAYDILSLDIGITSAMPVLPGFSEHGIPAKPLGPFAEAWSRFRATSGPAAIVVIGAGVAGAELAMAMAHAMRDDQRNAAVTVVESHRAFAAIGASANRQLRKALAAQGVILLEGRAPVEVLPNGLRLDDGSMLEATLIVGAAGARPHCWVKRTGLADADGYVSVDARLRSSDPAIFAVGDCASMRETPRPKAGVYAVRQAPVLYANLRAALTGTGGLRRYRPQADYLKLISLGEKAALGERFGATVNGPWVWRWKDRIDRRFMDRLTNLRRPAVPPLPWPRAAGRSAPLPALCGGCGAKLGAPALRKGLADTVPAAGDDAAILTTGSTQQVISTDHLRAFVEDPVTMTRIAVVHALGDIWAMGAIPQAATATVILPRQSEVLAARSLSEIQSTAAAVFNQAGATLVGGHTTFGAELTIGFTVTGLCKARPITLVGAQPGDALVLTKPIGSGVIMAAEMGLNASAQDVSAALKIMAQPQGEAAALLSTAHAMTDVTGFGLAGHLAALCNASGVGARLQLDTIPILPGAEALAARDVRSSLFEENRRVLSYLPDTARADLLFDPQTGGGLLAALPGPASETCDALRAAGYDAAIIGTITDHPGHIEIV
jgi:selenide,water dikinase